MAERILVTGARAAAALDIARALRAAGFEPHLADSRPARLSRWSRAPAAVHRHAPPVGRPADFADDVLRLLERLDPLLIIPTCEEVFHLAALAEARGFGERLFAPSLDRLAALHAKDAFAALCGRLGLPAPETAAAADPTTLRAAAGAMGDVVLKPVWSRFGGRTLPASAAEAAAPTADDPWVVQRRVAGEDVSFYAVCRAGRVVAFSAYGSDARAPGGAALSFRPLPEDLSTALQAMAGTLAAWAGDGQISCDAVVDRDGRPWLIECNPRATSGVHLFGRSAAFGTALSGRGEARPDGRPRHIGPALWRWAPARAWRGGAGPDVLSAPGDPLPVLGALADVAGFGLDALRAGRTLTAAMTADIEWNGRPFGPDHWSRP